MAKDTGFDEALYLGGHDLSGQVQQWQLGGSLAVQDVTTIRQKAFDRQALLPDGTLSHDTILDTDPDQAHDVLSAMPSSNEYALMCLKETLGGAAGGMACLQANYSAARASDASLLMKTEAQSSQGGFWDWGRLHTPGQRVDTGATNGASVDNGAAGTFGLQAYLQVLAFTGTDCTIAIQSSSDNGAGDAFATFTDSTFAVVTTAPQAQRIVTARNAAIERYLRVVTSGTFTSITFLVSIAVNPSLVRV